ncbi:MAG TPA: hypothetical protein PLS28_05880, partial [Clostridiales bacterium]|nr:hypothetical protein [Clostridiales bacterium]
DGTKKGDGTSSADSAKSKEGVNTDDPNHLVFWLCFAGGAVLGILLVAFVYKRKAVKASLAESEESDEDTEHPAE